MSKDQDKAEKQRQDKTRKLLEEVSKRLRLGHSEEYKVIKKELKVPPTSPQEPFEKKLPPLRVFIPERSLRKDKSLKHTPLHDIGLTQHRK